MSFISSKTILPATLAFTVLLAAASPTAAAIIVLTPAQLAGSTLIDFGPTETGAPINGQTISGVTFSYLVSGIPSNDAVLDGGPGATNNVTPANVVNLSSGNANSVLSMTFPTAEVRLGYGFAILSTIAVANATTVSLFDATNALVGTLSANGAPDPSFTGGFLGLESTIPFVRADVRFSAAAPAFAFDNLRFSPTSPSVIPEPATLTLVSLGVLGAAARRLRKRIRKPHSS